MSDVMFRVATKSDLDSIVTLLADDVLGAQRESADSADVAVYAAAFQEIIEDPRNELIVGDLDGKVVSVLQMTYIPGLAHQGAERAQIESVRVSSMLRNQGVGRAMFAWAIDRARQRGSQIVQLTTDQRRADAHRWYRSLGFEATHVGMKLRLDGDSEAQAPSPDEL